MKFSKYLKVAFFLLVIFLCVSNSSYAQRDLRGWHTQGQTFLVWKHSKLIPPDTYEIYTSSQPITSLSDATWIGRVFAKNGSNYRLHDYVPDARWKLPDTSGGTVTVAIIEAYFVVTPHSAGISHYAVVSPGDTMVGSGNTTGPIPETINPVSCTIQYQDSIGTIYAHWIDGRADHNSGRKGYPIMGNEYSNGLGFNFALWEQQGNPPGERPLNIWLHGGWDDLFWRDFDDFPDTTRSLLPNGFVASFDDHLPAGWNLIREYAGFNTLWFGYHKKYNRFSRSSPANTDTVINYTMRRVLWETRWLMDNYPIDSTRIFLIGLSMGAHGVGIFTQLFPELYNASLALVSRPAGTAHFERDTLVGTESQNLPTNLAGHPGVYDVFNWNWRLRNIYQGGYEWPFTIIVCGKKEEGDRWQQTPDFYRLLDSAKTGFALYWDERSHLPSGWIGEHFEYSEHFKPRYLARFRTDQSFPAFSETDWDLVTPGRQPDPGNGNPDDGDPWGTWGGYFEWDTGDIVDTVDQWAVTMWVVNQSKYPNDVPAADTILAHVTPRRLQQFQPQPGATYCWNFVKVLTGDTLQKGIVQADSDGIITVPDLLLIKEPARLTMTIGTPLGVEENRNVDKPICFSLYQNYPNPFNPETIIEYHLAQAAEVEISIFNLQGQKVTTLVSADKTAGVHEVIWNGKDEYGRQVVSGVYLYQLKIGKFTQVKKMMLLR